MPHATLKILFLLCGIFAGWASAYYFIEAFGSTVIAGKQQWRKWDVSAGKVSNPYALAHFLLAGKIPPAQSLFNIYSSGHDNEGNILQADCTYAVSVLDFNVRWWSLSLTPSNASDPTATPVISSDEIVRGGDGSMIISVAKHPIPGNWVRPATNGALEIQLLLSNDGQLTTTGTPILPSVQRVSC